MDYDLMNLFASQEAAEAFVLAFALAFLMAITISFIVATIFGFADIMVTKYKKKHGLM